VTDRLAGGFSGWAIAYSSLGKRCHSDPVNAIEIA
jgi:hypothetical protein